jgi:dolichol-phosphate mannosyltransferase
MCNRFAVILPSYNESDNIINLVNTIITQSLEVSVYIVDDNSPDGTSTLVADQISSNVNWCHRVFLITRKKKDGRGGAVNEGLRCAFKSPNNYSVFIEMDCDYSHDPNEISKGLEIINSGADIVVGARYPKGVIVGWPLSRRVFSFFANRMARLLINRKVTDYTNGFRFYNRRSVQTLLGHEPRHKGYIYLSESMSHLLNAQLDIRSFPITFVNRVRGDSNVDLTEIFSALTGIFKISYRHHFRK